MMPRDMSRQYQEIVEASVSPAAAPAVVSVAPATSAASVASAAAVAALAFVLGKKGVSGLPYLLHKFIYVKNSYFK
jgi:hypothetical protein